jgi:hypothetical protein
MTGDEAPQDSVRIILTADQRELVRRLSGQHVEALELTPDADDAESGVGGSLKFRWRLSAATGIPRQAWVGDDDPGSA